MCCKEDKVNVNHCSIIDSVELTLFAKQALAKIVENIFF